MIDPPSAPPHHHLLSPATNAQFLEPRAPCHTLGGATTVSAPGTLRRMDGLVKEFYVSGASKKVLYLTNEQAELVKDEPAAISRLLKELQAPHFVSPYLCERKPPSPVLVKSISSSALLSSTFPTLAGIHQSRICDQPAELSWNHL